MASQILDCFRIDTVIKEIGDIGVSELVRRYLEVEAVYDFRMVFVGAARRWCDRVFDALPIYIFIVGSFLCRSDDHILPYSPKLRTSEGLAFAVRNYIR